MNHYLASFISLCLAAVSSFSGRHDDRKKLDLLINGQNDPVAIVVLDDLKPGDDRKVEKDLYVNKDAKIFLHLKDLNASQGTQTEPEEFEESSLAGPKFNLQNYLTYSVAGFEKPLADLVSCWIPLGKLKKNKHLTLPQRFVFDASVTNWAQGDILTFTEEFIAIEGDSDYLPDTGTGRIWDQHTKKCVPKPSRH